MKKRTNTKMSVLEKILEEVGGKGTVKAARARGNASRTVLNSFNRPVLERIES